MSLAGCILFIHNYQLYFIHFTLYILHYTFYIIHFTLYILHFPSSCPLITPLPHREGQGGESFSLPSPATTVCGSKATAQVVRGCWFPSCAYMHVYRGTAGRH